jgi:hypothetical protein
VGSARQFRVVLAAVLAATVSACGGASQPTVRSIDGSDSPAHLLAAWAAFPINASPRPIVMAGAVVLAPPAFPDGDTKLDFLQGAFDLRSALPNSPSSVDGYPLVSAASALALLRSAGHPSKSSASPTTLAITAIRLDSASFATDRGDRTLPAWLFSFAGVSGSASVLAVAAAAQWSPVGAPSPATGATFVKATVAQGDRTLTAGFIGAQSGTGACTASYDLRLTESARAVVVTVIEHSHTSSGTACTLVGYARTATAVLAAPLGSRVVLDGVSGQPVAVTGA